MGFVADAQQMLPIPSMILLTAVPFTIHWVITPSE